MKKTKKNTVHVMQISWQNIFSSNRKAKPNPTKQTVSKVAATSGKYRLQTGNQRVACC
jgi:hypothetical protein